MSKPRTANPALAISEADLASALALIGTEIDHQPLRSSALARHARDVSWQQCRRCLGLAHGI